MNLIMEGWRKFLKEASIGEATKLAIYDFDGTIGFTGSRVIVLDKLSGTKRRFSDKEFLDFIDKLPEEERDLLEKGPGESETYKIDYSEYSRVSDDTVENRPILEAMYGHIKEEATSVFVLTARAPGEREEGGDPTSAVDDIQTYLKTFGLEPDHVMALAGESKADFINGLLRQNPSVTDLVVYEDSMSNLKSIDSMMAVRYSGLRHKVIGYKRVEQKVVDYSLFYVDGSKVMELDTEVQKKRGYDGEREEAHLAMSDYLHREHGLKKDTKGIALVMSQSSMRVKDLVKSLRTVKGQGWGRHLDTFVTILQDQIR
tara:strand:- start:1503 stop:2447 length:945 start_codon:yes stop_codon:yes gene_type:complete